MARGVGVQWYRPHSMEAPYHERDFARTIDAIMKSYACHGNINHLDGDNLPSRNEVTDLLEDLISILFPGYFVREHVDQLNCRYFVGERCARALRGLERAAARSLTSARGEANVTARAHEIALDLIHSIPSIRDVLDTDVQAALAGDPAARSSSEVIMSYPGVMATAAYRLAHALLRLDVPLLPRMITEIMHSRTGIDIHPGATIGNRFFIDHGTGVVIGETCLIGNNVKIYQGVTLGALSVRTGQDSSGNRRHPTLEDDVTIYAGATILGGDTIIGRGATVGGNVWLTHSVDPGTTVILDQPSLRMIQRPIM